MIFVDAVLLWGELKYTMNTLWSFGDSYAECYARDVNNEQYLNLIAKRLNYTHKSFGLSGTSISYTSYMFNQIRDNIQCDDKVVIVLTNLFRHWFFGDRPKEAALNVNLSHAEQKAIKHYMLYLENNLEWKTALLDFLYNVDYVTKEKNLKTIVMYGFYDVQNFTNFKEYKFENIRFANGTLDNMQRREFKADLYNKWVQVEKEQMGDPRLNHITKSNHYILADKIVDYFENNVNIDLTKDFLTDILDKDTDRNEFFGNGWSMFGL